jgi:hypothetical protein
VSSVVGLGFSFFNLPITTLPNYQICLSDDDLGDSLAHVAIPARSEESASLLLNFLRVPSCPSPALSEVEGVVKALISGQCRAMWKTAIRIYRHTIYSSRVGQPADPAGLLFNQDEKTLRS